MTSKCLNETEKDITISLKKAECSDNKACNHLPRLKTIDYH